MVAGLIAQGRTVAVLGRHVADPDRHTFPRGDPDDAVPERDLGPYARPQVTGGGHSIEPVGPPLAHQDHCVLDVEVPPEAIERTVEERVEIAALAEFRPAPPDGRQEVAGR